VTRRALNKDVAYPAALFLGFRVIFCLLGIVLVLLGLVPATEDPVTRPYFGVTPVVDGIAGALEGLWQRFDALHFLRIAENGYTAADLAAFPPAYPLLIRLVAGLTGGDLLASALLVANAACLLMLIVLYRWLRQEGYAEEVARRGLLYLLVFPTAFFLFVPYSESLFLLFVVLALRESRRGQWSRAALAALGASLTRLSGVCLIPVLAVEALRQGRGSPVRVVQRLAWSLSPALGLGSFLAWEARMGLPSALAVQAAHWHRVPAFPWQGLFLTVERAWLGTAFPIEYLDLLVTLGMLILGLILMRRLPLSLTVYHWTTLLFNLSQVRIGQPLSGQARFCLTLLPAFLLVALLSRSGWRNRLVVYPCFALNLILAGQFALWGWVG
jgi:hypothetical protein